MLFEGSLLGTCVLLQENCSLVERESKRIIFFAVGPSHVVGVSNRKNGVL